MINVKYKMHEINYAHYYIFAFNLINILIREKRILNYNSLR